MSLEVFEKFSTAYFKLHKSYSFQSLSMYVKYLSTALLCFVNDDYLDSGDKPLF